MVESAAELEEEQRRNGMTPSSTPSEMALIESWIAHDAAVEELDASAGRQARSQQEKTLFFATRDLQDVLSGLTRAPCRRGWTQGWSRCPTWGSRDHRGGRGNPTN